MTQEPMETWRESTHSRSREDRQAIHWMRQGKTCQNEPNAAYQALDRAGKKAYVHASDPFL